ncbi:LysM peptidoglycan-binding domain-containing protein [Pseudarthrobacter sp. DSP2-3-2b1]|uniref:LysM peptidoglycan-binding domain-containing protein n=1 Tax=Pseudarthrobacter sp. DSP2-3-2b1 TaxID=2804661 RepID=UPI003CF22171
MGFLDDLKKNLGLGDKNEAKDAPQAGAGVESGTTPSTPAESATPGVSQDQAAAQAGADQAAADQAAADQAAADQAAADRAAADQAAADRAAADQAAANQAAAAAPVPPAPAPAAVSEVVVEAGDTLGGIAVQFGVDLDALIAANADTVPNPDLIYPGQVLRLP